MSVKQHVFGVLVFLACIRSPLAAQVDEPPIPPDIPAWNRGIVNVWTEPGSTRGRHDIFARLAFESGALGRTTRDLSTEVFFLINGATVMNVSRTLVILEGSGTDCLAPPCDGSVCGSVSFAVSMADIYCRETSVCAEQPMGCECRCGDVLTVAGPRDQALQPGDEITVRIRPSAGSEAEVYTEDDSRTVPFSTRSPNADFTGDGMITLDDYRQFADCITGPSRRVPIGCGPGDFDLNGKIDLVDIAKLQIALTGFVIPCEPDSLKFHWPMPGVDARDWVINNYVDLIQNGGMLDYMGGVGSNAKTYDNHRGIDIDVSSFREMDNGFPIIAAAPGYVTFTRDSEYDRNTSCEPGTTWNVVTVEHANGFVSYYGHLKQNSVVVSVGDFVVAGQKLGVVGSSGCSTQAHLHFEVHDCDNKHIDPFFHNMFYNPPVYDTPLGFMDATLIDGVIDSIGQIKDPPPNVKVIQPWRTLGFGVSMAGGEAGDATTVTFRRPNGTVFTTNTWNWGGVFRHSIHWWTNPVIGELVTPLGFWKAEVRTNGTLVKTYNFGVSTISPNYTQVIQHNIPKANYQAVFDNIKAAGYRPVWVDGFDVFGAVFFNVIFDRSNVGPWSAHHNLTGQQYQDLVDQRSAQGYRLTHVDSYRDGNGIRYAAIFVKDGGPGWTAYHGRSVAEHVTLFNTFTGMGYRPVNISFVQVGSTTYVTALYDKKDVGVFQALAGLTSSAYQTAFNNNANAGRRLAYLDGYNEGGVAKFSAVWDSTSYNHWVARHDRTAGQFQADFDQWSAQGYLTRIITGYRNGLVANFGGFWTKK